MGRKKLFGVLILLSGMLIVPFVLGLGFVGINGNLFSSGTSEASTLSTATVFVDPVKVIDSRLQASNASKFTVHVNVSDVSDLFAWQINMTWNASVLRVNKITAGEFLLRTGSASKTASYGLGFVINVTDNVAGRSFMAESILGGVPGISGNGRLVSVEFLVVGYGSSGLNLGLAGNMPTTLLNSTTLPNNSHGTISFTKSDGYFRNTILGDANGDRVVDVFDVLKVKYHRSGPPPGPGGYSRDVDMNDDGSIDVFDVLIVKDNLGHSIP